MKEGRTYLFNDALNAFYLRFYGDGHMVKHHSDSQRGNPLSPLVGLHFLISSNVVGFYTHHPTDRIANTMAYGALVVKHMLKSEIAQLVHY